MPLPHTIRSGGDDFAEVYPASNPKNAHAYDPQWQALSRKADASHSAYVKAGIQQSKPTSRLNPFGRQGRKEHLSGLHAQYVADRDEMRSYYNSRNLSSGQFGG